MSNFDQVYKKNNLQHQINFIRYTMKYLLIKHLFGIVGVNMFFYKIYQG